MKRYFILLLLLFIIGCGTSTQFVMQDKSVKLSQFNNVYVGMFKGTSPASPEGTTFAVGRDILRDKEAQFALENFKVELAKIGFNVVNDPLKANAYVDFNISSIRQNAVLGWIADKAIVKFIKTENNEVIAYFTADGVLITPTVDNIIRNLAERIKRCY